MREQLDIVSALKMWGIRAALMLFGIGTGVGIIWLILPVIMPQGNQSMANVDLEQVNFHIGNGDLFVAMPGLIAPPDNPYEILSQHRLAWDADGFRVPARPAETYNVLALGDSYTEAANVALPWSDILAQETGLAVKNLGFRGYGPIEEARVMQTYGSQYAADTVVLGFFGGNDLANAVDYDADSFALPEILRESFASFSMEERIWESDNTSYQYPVQIDLNGRTLPMAFLNGYISWLNITPQTIRQSENLAQVVQSWHAIADELPDSRCFLITYFPSKPQIYLPYAVPEDRPRLVNGRVERVLPQAGSTIRNDDEANVTFDAIVQRRNHLPQVLAQAADDAGYTFLDLTPHFERAAANGELLYYTYDTHWNQDGHRLAAQHIAERLTAMNCPR